MIKVIIGNNLSRKSVIIDENTIIKEALAANDVDYTRGVTTLDGATLTASEMNKSFAALGVTSDCMLLNVVKADNAAKISVKAGVAFVESAMKLSDVKTLAKYAPKALSLMSDDGKSEVFKVGVTSGSGSVNAYGVSFGTGVTKDGNAVVTMMIPEGTENPKAWVMDKVGSAILNLGKVEKQAEKSLASVAADLSAIEDTITVE